MMLMQHHAFVIEAELEEGIELAFAHARKTLGLTIEGNPDVVALRYGLLSVEEARRINDLAMQAPIVGDRKVIVLAAQRAYHESQNALLKLFEEPPRGTSLYFILPSLGGLLPTLRSRVQILQAEGKERMAISEPAAAFIKATKEKRSALIKRLASGKDEEERREHRDEAIAIVNGIEAVAYQKIQAARIATLLSDLAVLRAFLHERSAPVRMILEHLSLVLPKNLL